MDTNTIVIFLLISLMILQGVGIYLLLIRKRFKITSDTATTDIANFLNSLDEEMSERTENIEKLLENFSSDLKTNEASRLNLSYELKHSNQKVVTEIKDKVTNTHGEIKQIVSVLNDMLKNHLSDVGHTIKVMKEEIIALKELTEEKDIIIRRYEEGFNQQSIKKFNKEFFNILDSIQVELKEQNNNALKEVEEDLFLLLDNHGIEKMDIHIGQNYDEISKQAKIIETIIVDNEEQHKTVKEIKKDGYTTYISDDKQKVLRIAEVVIYKYNKPEGV